MTDNTALVAAYWKEFSLTRPYSKAFSELSGKPAIKQDATYDAIDRSASAEVFDRVYAKAPGIIQLMVDLAEAAPDDWALACLGAGDLETLLNYANLSDEQIVELKAEIKKSPKLQEAVKHVWVSADGFSPTVEELLYG